MIQILITVLAFSIVVAAYSYPAAQTDKKFVPVFFDKTEDIQIDGKPERVFQYFEPKWRKFMYHWWELKEVFVPSNGSLLGASFRVSPPNHEDKEAIFVNVTHLDTDAKEIQYSIMWGDYELQKIEITCKSNPRGGTTARIRTMTYGLTPEGNKAVTEYSTQGGEQAGNARYAKELNKYLTGESQNKIRGH